MAMATATAMAMATATAMAARRVAPSPPAGGRRFLDDG
jgi:hypothetical protein